MRLNKEKCKISVKKVIFLGHEFSAQEIKPDYSKIKAITEIKCEKEINMHVNTVVTHLSMSEETLNKVKNASSLDGDISLLRKYYLERWPSYNNKVKDIIEPYWKLQSQIYSVDQLSILW
ncbi:hypothetical protein HHI36_012935 [Cryptolaemus montrouzieri]|uniref:Uncharacterized protein n=1 Tax=Cryptolaemus montrouzieri TaxID=559131 RepID=A0ABD2NFP1_9CUCU